MIPATSPGREEEILPGLRQRPSKLFVETTSRCNLGCFMCMKQTAGHESSEGDLQPEIFEALEPALGHIDALILNGVGEPLLNPRLEQYIARAKRLLPRQAWVGFQTNGLLLTNIRALSLIDAGLDRICLSMDGASADTFRAIRDGGELSDFEWALSALASARERCGRRDFQIGVEFVIMRDNLRELPEALRRAASGGANFALASHLLPYDEIHASGCAYDLCTDEAITLFQSWKEKAERAGVAIERYFKVLWKFSRTPEEQRIVNVVESMKAAAQHRGIVLDLRRLLAADSSRLDEVMEVFAEARVVARETGLELRLPEAVPRERRRCDFVEQGGAFVSWDGKVHPCYYLWHACRSFASGWMHPVKPRVFGSVAERGILEIWNAPEFRTYRENVIRHDYPACSGCNFAPCDYVQAETFEQDCYVNAEPCGGCLWSSGLFQCLT
jgi:putative metalloenzyme radical SAM/SPASM domain maturase